MQRILKTDRLILRPATLLDAGAIFGAMEYDISKWLTRVPHPYSITDAQDWLSSLRFECGSYVWAITRAGEVIGMIGLDPTLGYWIAKEHWGQGYVSEAAHAVLTAYFSDPFAEPAYSSYFVENERSARVLSRLGYSPLGKPVATLSAARQGELPLQRVVLTPEQWAALNPLVVTGQKTKLRPIAESDCPSAYKVFSLECVAKNLAFLPHPLPTEFLKNRIAKSRWKNGWNAGLAIENESGEFIGWIGFNSPSQGMKQDMSFGYALHPDHWGCGYMSDAVDALTHYLFQRYPIEKITAYANVDNIGSQRVLHKTGFRNIGEEDQHSPARGTFDHVYRFERYRT